MAMATYARSCAARCGLNPRQTEDEVRTALANATYSDVAQLANCHGGDVLPGQLLWVIGAAREEKLRRLALETGTPIQRLIAKGDTAKFRDFANVKSGRDQYSALPLAKLVTMVSAEDIRVIDDHSSLSDTAKAKTLRWVLRGLPALMALQKVAVDEEISASVIRKRERDEEFEMDPKGFLMGVYDEQ